MKRLLFAMGFFLTTLCVAQQPDVRLQLMSLYKINSATVVPLVGARMRWCAKCESKPWKQSLHLIGSDSLVKNNDGGKSAQVLWIDGGARIETGVAPPRTFHVPLEIHAKSGALVLIARMPMEEYVAAVVQGETSGDMPPEALRAMAVAARTYATHFRERHKIEGFDFCDSTHCQFVRTEITANVAAAVTATRGELLWDRGKPLAAYYHQDCGGRTEAASVVWPDVESLSAGSQSDPYCVRVSRPWRSEISRSDLNAALKSAGLRVPQAWNRIRVSQRTPSGRARTLVFAAGSAENGIPVAASSLRFAVGRSLGWSSIKSDLYEVTALGDHIVFTGRGTGHGVGMCQLGATEMAREGKSYRDILAFYYPGATIGIAASGIVWRKLASAELDVFAVEGDSAVIDTAPRALAWAESQTGLHAAARPAVYVYPSVEMFRNATGEPGWVAASTRSNKIRMQPAKVLGARIESVIRHEFVHFLLEAHAAPRTPIWFREGLAMLITGDVPTGAPNLSPQQMEAALRNRSDDKATQAAYASALASVVQLERRYGRAELLRWLARGIPAGVLEGVQRDGRTQEAPHQR